MKAVRILGLFGEWIVWPFAPRAERRVIASWPSPESLSLAERIQELIAEANETSLPPGALLAANPMLTDAETYLSLSAPSRVGHPLAPF